ncbi:hypothetical protein Pmani_039627 [Petrolisthes manimaculis]|uniref:Uncharacterized protein n=1 Tax=Petrolisthes manimaculis TaxID=1843537 RepID=A0AAE1TL63_9EUCA|nr:hypothetical protein Pmani_039627 [Petrolisthes manimaculis]
MPPALRSRCAAPPQNQHCAVIRRAGLRSLVAIKFPNSPHPLLPKHFPRRGHYHNQVSSSPIISVVA